jgi:hypothetical protein
MQGVLCRFLELLSPVRFKLQGTGRYREGTGMVSSLERLPGAQYLTFHGLVRRGKDGMNMRWRAVTIVVEMTDPLAAHPVPAPLVFPQTWGMMEKDQRCGGTV